MLPAARFRRGSRSLVRIISKSASRRGLIPRHRRDPSGCRFFGIHPSRQSCRVVLVFIGRDWLSAVGANGARRLDDPKDHVRLELETAFRVSEIRVIPVLVRRAEMPGESDLPTSLRRLALLNAKTVRSGADYQHDVARLIRHIHAALDEWLRDRELKAEETRRAAMARGASHETDLLTESDLQLPAGTVFISHAYEDRNSARRLADTIERAGLHVWSTHFSGLLASRDAQAQRAVQQCSMFLPLISQYTENRTEGFYRREWNFAVLHNAFIAPILVDPLQPLVRRDVILLRHYDVHLVPPEFRNLAPSTCPSGRATSEFIAWIKEIAGVRS